jgi:hypothetical protein
MRYGWLAERGNQRLAVAHLRLATLASLIFPTDDRLSCRVVQRLWGTLDYAYLRQLRIVVRPFDYPFRS